MKIKIRLSLHVDLEVEKYLRNMSEKKKNKKDYNRCTLLSTQQSEGVSFRY